jgi:DNA-binding XRE family transcriptional regulator
MGYKGAQQNGGKQHNVPLAWYLLRPTIAFSGTDVSADSLAFFIDRGWKQVNKNQLREIRESLLMSKAELARKAGVSPITIDRIEKGMDCRMETKRKILLALGYELSEKDKLFQR